MHALKNCHLQPKRRQIHDRVENAQLSCFPATSVEMIQSRSYENHEWRMIKNDLIRSAIKRRDLDGVLVEMWIVRLAD